MIVPSFVILFIPDDIASVYTIVALPFALLLGSIFAAWVSLNYQKELQKTFIFLFMFLLLMMIANIDPLWMYLKQIAGVYLPLIALSLQWVTYLMLIIACVYILRVTEVRKIGRYGWIAIFFISLIGIIVITHNMGEVISDIVNGPNIYNVSLFAIRFLDVAIVIMLMPVLLLYMQQMRLECRESITFATIVSGIIISLMAAYLYEIIFNVPLYVVSSSVYHTGSLLDAFYIYGYLMIAVGLYVHKRYDEWGFSMIKRALDMA